MDRRSSLYACGQPFTRLSVARQSTRRLLAASASVAGAKGTDQDCLGSQASSTRDRQERVQARLGRGQALAWFLAERRDVRCRSFYESLFSG